MSNMFGNGQGQMVQMPIMTPAQRDELERVQGMQIRTQAANMASLVLQHQHTSEARWVKFATAIEAFIRGEKVADAVAAPLRARPKTG